MLWMGGWVPLGSKEIPWVALLGAYFLLTSTEVLGNSACSDFYNEERTPAARSRGVEKGSRPNQLLSSEHGTHPRRVNPPRIWEPVSSEFLSRNQVTGGVFRLSLEDGAGRGADYFARRGFEAEELGPSRGVVTFEVHRPKGEDTQEEARFETYEEYVAIRERLSKNGPSYEYRERVPAKKRWCGNCNCYHHEGGGTRRKTGSSSYRNIDWTVFERRYEITGDGVNLVRLLADGIEAPVETVSETVYARAVQVDLRYQNLAGANLPYSTFKDTRGQRASLNFAQATGAQFEGADFSYATGERLEAPGSSVSGGSFRNGRFEDSNWRGSEHEGVDYSGSRFNRANFGESTHQDSNWRGANLEGSSWRGSDVSGGSMERANFERGDFREAQIEGVPFGNAIFRGSNWNEAGVTNSRFERTVWDSATLTGAAFYDCTMTGVAWKAVEAERVVFQPSEGTSNCSNCTIEGGNWKGASFQGSDLARLRAQDAEMTGANFQKTELTEGTFTGVKLREADFAEAQGERVRFKDTDAESAQFKDAHFPGLLVEKTNLTGARFDGAVISDGRFGEGALLRGASFASADLTGTNLLEAEGFGPIGPNMKLNQAKLSDLDHPKDLSESSFRGRYEGLLAESADFSNARAASAEFVSSNFERTTWNGSDMRETHFEQNSRLSDSNFDGVNGIGMAWINVQALRVTITNSDLERARVEDSVLTTASITNCNFGFKASFRRTDFTGSDLRSNSFLEADFTSSILKEVDLRGSDMAGASFRGADLTGAKIDDTSVLQGAVYDRSTVLPFSADKAAEYGMRFEE